MTTREATEPVLFVRVVPMGRRWGWELRYRRGGPDIAESLLNYTTKSGALRSAISFVTRLDEGAIQVES